MNKGRQLAITGSIRTGSYDAKDGTKRYTSDVIVDSFEFIGTGQAQQNNGNVNQNGNFGAGVKFDDDMTPVDDGDMPF